MVRYGVVGYGWAGLGVVRQLTRSGEFWCGEVGYCKVVLGEAGFKKGEIK